MRLDITGRHVTVTPALRQLITKRLVTLERVLNDSALSALVIVTEWNEFRALDLERMKSILAEPVLVDLRNIYTPA